MSRSPRGMVAGLGVLVTLAVAAVPVELAAQAVPGERLTLERALELARRNNPELRKALHEVERAVASERSSWGAFLPEIWAEGNFREFSSRTLTGENEYRQPVALEEAVSVSGTSASGSVTASLMLFRGFQNVNELRSARAGRRAADALHLAEVVRIEAEVARRFYDAVGGARLHEVEERLFAAAGDRLEAMRAMEAAGRATPQDVLGAEADLERQEMALDAARTNAYVARLVLGEVLGLDDGAAVEIAASFPEPVDPGEWSEEEVAESALRTSPRLARAESVAQQASHAASAAGAARWPTVRLSMGLDRGISLPERNQIGDFPWNRGFGFGLTASIPVFTGFALTERVTRARTIEADAAEDLRRARLGVEREARSAWAEATRAYQGVRRAERAAGLELQRMETAQEGFRMGLIGFTELQQLIDRAALAERTAVRASMEYARAMATLSEVTGGAVSGVGLD